MKRVARCALVAKSGFNLRRSFFVLRCLSGLSSALSRSYASPSIFVSRSLRPDCAVGRL